MSSIRRVDMFMLVMMMGKTDPRMAQALGKWSRIAPELGFDPDDFRAKLIWQKDEPNRSHVVLRLRGPRILILKCAFLRPIGDDPTLAIAAQRDAHARLKPFPKAHAPEILYSSEVGDFVVMEEASGKTLDNHLRNGRNPALMLKRTGAWLAAFHQSSEVEERIYQPSFMVNHCERMADDVELGKIHVADPERFLVCCRLVREKSASATHQKTISATKHGDFNSRNIMLGPNGETGIDFKPLSTAPVGFDIARILMDYAEIFQPIDDLMSGQLLSNATIDAFFYGYDLVTPDDPAVRFLPFVQILNDWRAIPVDPLYRSWRQAARYKAIARLANNGFAST